MFLNSLTWKFLKFCVSSLDSSCDLIQHGPSRKTDGMYYLRAKNTQPAFPVSLNRIKYSTLLKTGPRLSRGFLYVSYPPRIELWTLDENSKKENEKECVKAVLYIVILEYSLYSKLSCCIRFIHTYSSLKITAMQPSQSEID